MILLKTNEELKKVFDYLIRSMEFQVEWNGTFLVLYNNLVLPGRVRSLFFDFGGRKLYTNVVELNLNWEEAEEITDSEMISNILNMTLYIFGKWGMMKGLKVEKTYGQLCGMFKNVLEETGIEPDFQADRLRFYDQGRMITYEDLIQKALTIAKEAKAETAVEQAEPSGEETTGGLGLWHNIRWKMMEASFRRSIKTAEDMRHSRLGHNFYLVDYMCPACGKKLYMILYPVGNEQRIETEEGGIFLARAYSCESCRCFYTPRPGRLLKEGLIYGLDFEEDKTAYEDYLDLLGKNGTRECNYKFNEYEAARSQKNEEPKTLQQACENLEHMDEQELGVLLEQMEDGFYPAKEVEQYKTRVKSYFNRAKKRRKTKEASNPLPASDSGDSAETGAGNTISADAAGSAGTKSRKSAAVSGDAENPGGRGGKEMGEEIHPSQISAWKKNDKDRDRVQNGMNPDLRRLWKEKDKPEKLKRRVRRLNQSDENAGCTPGEKTKSPRAKGAAYSDESRRYWQDHKNIVSRKAAGRLKRLRSNRIKSDRESQAAASLYTERQKQGIGHRENEEKTRSTITADINAANENVKNKDTVNKNAVYENAGYGNARNDMTGNDNADRFLEQTQRETVRFGGGNLSGPKNRANPVKPLPDDRAEMPLSESAQEEAADKKRKETAKIRVLLKAGDKRSREGLLKLAEQLEELGCEEENVRPYLDKIADKVRSMDQKAIAEICPDPSEVNFEDGLQAYEDIAAGPFLPELKIHTLEMLDKRLSKIKQEEQLQLVKKFKKSLLEAGVGLDRLYFCEQDAEEEAAENETENETGNGIVEMALATYGYSRNQYEYPILVCDASSFRNGKTGVVLTPDHIYYHGLLNTVEVPVMEAAGITAKTGLLNKGIYLKTKNGGKERLPIQLEDGAWEGFAQAFAEFLKYLQEKPQSRNISYLARETHEKICCFRCGYVYTGGDVCPKCGSRINS